MPRTYSAIEMLDKLVAFDTVSRNSNLPLIQFVGNYLADHGVKSHYVYNSDKSKANLFANIGPSEDGGVVLSGHTDVVPVDGQTWSTNPFKVKEKDGKIFGRGTCDMKGFIAICLALVPEMLGAKITKPIQLALSYDEEVGCIGAPFMISQMKKVLPTASSVIVGEPTMLELVDGHKASIGLDTKVVGFEVHSSLLPTGVSAIMTAAKLINWIIVKTEKNKNRKPKPEDTDFFPSYTTLHVGKIKGGTASNITAKDCEFTMDIRCLPSENGESLIQEYENFSKLIEAENKKINSQSEIIIKRHHWVPGLIPEEKGTAENLIRRITGINSTSKVSYGTEAGQFQQEGYSTVIFGPGSIERAHQPNEYLEADQLFKGVEFIRSLIKELSS